MSGWLFDKFTSARLYNVADKRLRIDFKIPVNASESDPISINDIGPRGLAVVFPVGASVTWNAADITFEVAETRNGPWTPLRDAEDQALRITNITTAAPRVGITQVQRTAPAGVWSVGAWPWIRIASIAVGGNAAVVQTAERNLQLVCFS